MTKSNFEKAIQDAATAFALRIVDTVKGATLQELLKLQSEVSGRKTGPKPRSKTAAKTTDKEVAPKPPVKKKRVVKNYPKCAYPGCNKNRFVRGKGFCGEHWREWKAGKIKAAETYKK